MRKTFTTILAIILPTGAFADHELSGMWRCVLNSAPVSIDLQVQFQPDGSAFAQGTYILNGTSGFYQIQGPGRYIYGPADEPPPGMIYRIQFAPGNVATFSMFVRPTQTPGMLYNTYAPPGGGIVETACQRLR
jgi:hypothetical protein